MGRPALPQAPTRNKKLQQGILKCVLSPLIFVFFIDNLTVMDYFPSSFIIKISNIKNYSMTTYTMQFFIEDSKIEDSETDWLQI